ncbi:uncharacterized protein I303_104878 [Kwoniella dejecticola CBS 10117]|uniref:Uncharacterized protein n=1 Tax=Kwoniella dejecticola CBS 10117 TaxID=1296121 RepID=A0A1A6A434_9TREE|nr:uncharacterized protein I303_04138 [Kwoniella dejecticola CBS 10117]OBR84817.1 hypothetical protein I303_04138 [Kwoniella dejecticola CBS 10117]
MSISKERISSSRNGLPNSGFTSRIPAPSTLPLRTTSRIRQPQSSRNNPSIKWKGQAEGLTGISRIPPPRVSFLTPREVWSPLATLIPGMTSSSESSGIMGGPATPRMPKYQLKDTGPIPSSSSQLPSTSIPRPPIRPRPVSRPSVKAHRQPSIHRSSLQMPRPQPRPPAQFTSTQLSSRLPLPSSSSRSRPLSLPPNEASPIAIPPTRPTSYQTPPSLTNGLPTSIAPSRELSDQSNSSSTYSSASSLARHRAIKGRGKDRSSFARLSAYSPPNHGALIKALCVESESEESESTISDHSIRTVATVNQAVTVETTPTRHISLSASINESEKSFHAEPESKQPSILSADNHQGGLTAPYLVPSSAPPMTLQWESDESSGEVDDAERVWRELEAKLGRKVRGRSLRRGRWVVKPKGDTGSFDTPHLDEEEVDEEENVSGVEMEKSPSGFSISMYCSPSSSKSTPPLTIDRVRPSSFTYGSSPMVSSPTSATALFDMTAPLVPSGINNGCTPWNTPLLNKGSIKRGARVKKRYASVDAAEIGPKSRLGSLEEAERVEFRPQPFDEQPFSHTEISSNPPYSWSAPNQSDGRRSEPRASSPVRSDESDEDDDEGPVTKSPSSRPMYRLDSHIVSALSALQGSYDSPELDFALSSSPISSPISDTFVDDEDESLEGGLGLGMNLRLKTIYHLPTLSPKLRPSATRASVVTSRPQEVSLSSDRSEEKMHATESNTKVIDEVSHGKDIGGMAQVGDSNDDDVLVIRDLDTGLERQVRVGDGLSLT